MTVRAVRKHSDAPVVAFCFNGQDGHHFDHCRAANNIACACSTKKPGRLTEL